MIMDQRSLTVGRPAEQDSNRVKVLNCYGLHLMAERRYEAAIVSFNRSISLQPQNDSAWYYRGESLATLRRYAEALISFERAIALNPTCPAAWTFHAVVLIYLERYAEALTSCDRALAIAPEDAEALTFRGVALQRLGHYKAAYAAYQKVTGESSWWTRLQRAIVRFAARALECLKSRF